MATSTDSQCAACGTPATTRCTGCTEGLDPKGDLCPTYYCAKACQVAHWDHHKRQCKLANARKQLYRGGELLQTIFYKYRGQFFDLKIDKIHKPEDTDTIFATETRKQKGEFLFPFPVSLVKDERDKKALLAWSACIAVNIEDIHITLTDTSAPPRVIVVRTDGQPDDGYFDLPHQLLRVTLQNGEAYALNITGAQFGHMEAVTPWNTYEAKRAVDVRPQQFGSARRRVQKRYEEGYTPFERMTCETDIMDSNFRQSLALDKAVAEWVELTGTTIPELLRAPRARYEGMSVELLSFAMRGVIRAAAEHELVQKGNGGDEQGAGKDRVAAAEREAQKREDLVAETSKLTVTDDSSQQ